MLPRSAVLGCGGVDDLVVGRALVSRALRGAGDGIRDWTLQSVPGEWSGDFHFDVVSGSRLYVVRRDVVFGCLRRCLAFVIVGHGSCMCSMGALLWE